MRFLSGDVSRRLGDVLDTLVSALRDRIEPKRPYANAELRKCFDGMHNSFDS